MTAAERDRDALAARRRRAALTLHPDRGGDVEEFVRVMRALEERPRSVGRPSGVTVVRTARGRQQRLRVAGRDATLALRGMLPRSVPGARRYAQL